MNKRNTVKIGNGVTSKSTFRIFYYKSYKKTTKEQKSSKVQIYQRNILMVSR